MLFLLKAKPGKEPVDILYFEEIKLQTVLFQDTAATISLFWSDNNHDHPLHNHHVLVFKHCHHHHLLKEEEKCGGGGGGGEGGEGEEGVRGGAGGLDVWAEGGGSSKKTTKVGLKERGLLFNSVEKLSVLTPY